MGKYTADRVNRAFKGKYIEIRKEYDYGIKEWLYEVLKEYDEIHENTTLGEDVGTSLEYTR